MYLSTDPTLSLHTMRSALGLLPDKEWRKFGKCIEMPDSTLGKIESQFTSDKERKMELYRVYSTEHPQPTWEHASNALYKLHDGEYHNVLDHLQSLFPTG